MNHKHLGIAAATALAIAWAGIAQAHGDHSAFSHSHEHQTIVLAQAGGTEPGELEPRYQPIPEEEPDGYNEDYLFAITRALVNSTVVPAAKAPLFLLTVPLDLALLPITLIGGFFG